RTGQRARSSAFESGERKRNEPQRHRDTEKTKAESNRGLKKEEERRVRGYPLPLCFFLLSPLLLLSSLCLCVSVVRSSFAHSALGAWRPLRGADGGVSSSSVASSVLSVAIRAEFSRPRFSRIFCVNSSSRVGFSRRYSLAFSEPLPRPMSP